MTREAKKKIIKKILNAVFLIAVIGLTSWGLLKDQDLAKIGRELLEIRPVYLAAGAFIVVLFVCCESVIMKILLRAANVDAPLRHCIPISFIGFFYSLVTPSATGGQPMQIYYMRRHGIRVGTASAVLMIITIEYKTVLILLGFFLMIFCRGLIQSLDPSVQVLFTVGFILNVVFVAALAALVFMPRFAHRLVRRIFRMLSKIRMLHLTEARLQRVEESMDLYHDAVGLIRGHIPAITGTQVLTILQRLLLFSLTYVVYIALELRGAHLLPVIGRQAVVSIGSDMLPTPGGLGFSEYIYMCNFEPVFGSELMTTVSLTVSRGFSYYFLVIISGIVTFYAHTSLMVKARRRKRKEHTEKNQMNHSDNLP